MVCKWMWLWCVLLVFFVRVCVCKSLFGRSPPFDTDRGSLELRRLVYTLHTTQYIRSAHANTTHTRPPPQWLHSSWDKAQARLKCVCACVRVHMFEYVVSGAQTRRRDHDTHEAAADGWRRRFFRLCTFARCGAALVCSFSSCLRSTRTDAGAYTYARAS